MELRVSQRDKQLEPIHTDRMALFLNDNVSKNVSWTDVCDRIIKAYVNSNTVEYIRLDAMYYIMELELFSYDL